MKDWDVVFQITCLLWSKCYLLILFEWLFPLPFHELQSDYIGFSDLNNSPVNLSFLIRELWQSDNAHLKNRQILKVIMRNDFSDWLKYWGKIQTNWGKSRSRSRVNRTLRVNYSPERNDRTLGAILKDMVNHSISYFVPKAIELKIIGNHRNWRGIRKVTS
jgi:hypothetical protein